MDIVTHKTKNMDKWYLYIVQVGLRYVGMHINKHKNNQLTAMLWVVLRCADWAVFYSKSDVTVTGSLWEPSAEVG